MIIHSNTPTTRTDTSPSLMDIVSARSSKAEYQANVNKNRIQSQSNAIANQSKEINEITNELPHTQTKTSYIYDTECVFDKYYDGTVLANVTTESGKSIPCVAEIDGNNIRVTFEALNEVATVTITTM